MTPGHEGRSSSCGWAITARHEAARPDEPDWAGKAEALFVLCERRRRSSCAGEVPKVAKQNGGQPAFGSTKPEDSGAARRGAISDARKASSADQTVADADQSVSDADQLSSDRDQTASKSRPDRRGPRSAGIGTGPGDGRQGPCSPARSDPGRGERIRKLARVSPETPRLSASATNTDVKRRLATETRRRPTGIGWRRSATREAGGGTLTRPTWSCRRANVRPAAARARGAARSGRGGSSTGGGRSCSSGFRQSEGGRRTGATRSGAASRPPRRADWCLSARDGSTGPDPRDRARSTVGRPIGRRVRRRRHAESRE